MAKPKYITTITDEDWAKASKTERSVHVSRSQIGVKEASRNSGREIDRYLKMAGGHPGDPWCAAQRYWCCVQAGFSGADLPKHGLSVYGWYSWALQTGRLVKIENIRRGDMYGWIDKSGGGWHGHIGQCAGVQGHQIRGFEGNTNEAGSREGTCSMQKIRTFESMKGHDIVFAVRMEFEKAK